MTTSPTSARIASVIARKSSTSKLGVPSGRRAWMWIMEPPSSTIRRASAAYSSGVYGIAGHWSRLATAPEMLQVMIAGSSKRLTSTVASYGHHPMLLPGSLHALGLRELQSANNRGARLARVYDVVDHRVARRDVGVDRLADPLDHLRARRVRVIGGLDLLAEDDVDRALR